MSLEDDLKDVGDSIGRLVDNAVNSQNFQELNEKITDTINQFIYPNRKGPYRANNANPYRRPEEPQRSVSPYSQQQKGDNPYRSVNSRAASGPSGAPPHRRELIRQNQQWLTQRAQYRERFMAPSDLVVVGGFQSIAGWFLAVVFGASAVGTLIGLLAEGFLLPVLILFLVFTGFAGAGAVLIKKGGSNRKLIRHFRQLCNILGSREYISTKELSDRMHLPKGPLLQELTRMIEKCMLRQGHLDQDGTCLMVTDSCYRQYQELLHQQELTQRQEAQKQKELESSGLTPEYQEMLAECESYIQKIHQCNEDLPGEIISAKLSRLELVVTRILQEAKRRPAEAGQLRKFMDYYMPTTWKLLDAYRSFEREPIQSENIKKTRQEIENTLDTINGAFEKLLDDLFQTTAWDISSDISVLETMLAQEGLTEQGLNN